jgi:transcriptional regulator with XRE-family HTH domain
MKQGEKMKQEILTAKSIKKYRLAKGMTVIELAKLVNLSRTSIYSYENGSQVPSPKRLTKIAKVLGVKPIQLLGG